MLPDGNKHIVVINDNPMHVRLITSILKKAGYTARSFPSAVKALEHMTANGAPPLIITDIHMPGIDGWKLCRLLKSDVFSWLNRVPVIVISSTFSGTPTKEVTVQTGADAFLSIPFKPDDLVTYVNTLSEGGKISQRRRAIVCSCSGENAAETVQFLEKRGFDTTVATSKDEVIAFINEAPPELAVLDIGECFRSGEELIKAIRSGASLTVIIVTIGETDGDLVTRLFSLGADGYVLRPYDTEDLLVQFETIHRERSLLRIEDLLEKRSESLRESEERYRSLISSIQTGFALFESDLDDSGHPIKMRFLEVNSAFEHMMHLTPGSAVGKRVSDVFDPGFLPLDEWTTLFGKLATSGGELQFEHYFQDIDHWYRIIAYSPRFGRFAVQLVDVHERKMAQAALQEKEALLSNVLESIPDHLAVLDRDLRIIYSNWHDFSHIPEEVRLSKPKCHEIYHDCGFPCDKCVVRNVFHNGRLAKKEFRSDDTNKILESSVYPVVGPDGEINLVVEHVRDVTDQKRAEDERLRMNKLESIGALAGGIAHDYNNILATILGNTSLARMLTGKENDLLAVLDEIETAGNRAKALNQKFITFSKGGDPVRQVGDLAELVRDSVALSLTGSHIEHTLIFEPEVLEAEFDSGQLQHAFHNILLNAKQAIPEDGTVMIIGTYCTVTGEENLPIENGLYVKIVFNDTGTGITEEDLARVFDPYFTTKPDASGLGLATTYSVIQKHNGCMTIDSIVGSGTAVTVYLPAMEKAVEPVPVPSTEGEDRHMKILVMDDEPAVMKVVKKMLSNLGNEVDGARDGSEAIEAYKRALEAGSPYDVVIMDLTIPEGMGGKEAIERLRQIDPNITAIVSSGYSSDPVLSDYEAYGFSGIITKPFHMRDLKETLRAL